MESLFLSFASQLKVNVSSRPSSRLATAETLRPRRCPYALCDSLCRQNTLHVSFNPRCLPLPLTFHVFREHAHTASVGLVARPSLKRVCRLCNLPSPPPYAIRSPNEIRFTFNAS